MSAVAVLLLLPRVVLLPPEAPPDLAPLAASCADAVAASPELQVTRSAAVADAGGGAAERVRPTLAGAVEAYRAMRLPEARAQAEEVITALEAEGRTGADFELLLQARLRLAATLLAQRREAHARQILEDAARQAPDARVTDADWPPNLVAAWDAARARVTAVPAPPPPITVATSIAGLAAQLSVDGRAVTGAPAGLPAGDHVFVATAPGHQTIRQVVRLPLAAPLTITLPADAGAPGAIVLSLRLARTGAGTVHLTMRRHGGAEATRDVDDTGAPRAARELAETLAGVARAVAAQQPRMVEGALVVPGAEGGGGTSSRRSIFTRWWFWTLVGGVATAGLLVGVAASRQDPGTDVFVRTSP